MQKNREEIMNRYHKLKVAMRYYLLGRAKDCPDFLTALYAMEYGEALHNGTRADRVTPEFMHQLEIAHYLRTLEPGLTYKAETLAATHLHDTLEDIKEVKYSDIVAKFGPVIAEACERLNKTTASGKKDMNDYFGEIARCPIASVVKGADRVNNLQSMIGVFSQKKQASYMQEVHDYFFPMLKEARRRFPDQEPVYENIKTMLRYQCQLIASLHEAVVPTTSA